MARKKKQNKEVKPKEMESEDQKAFSLGLTKNTKRSIAAVFCITLALVFVLGFLKQAGPFGEFLDKSLSGAAFGWGKWIFPFLLLFSGYVLLRKSIRFYHSVIIGLTVSFFSLLGLLHAVFFSQEEYLVAANLAQGGGYAGYYMAMFLTQYLGRFVTALIFFTLCFAGLMVSFNISLVTLFNKIVLLKNISLPFVHKISNEKRDGTDIAAPSEGDEQNSTSNDAEQALDQKENDGYTETEQDGHKGESGGVNEDSQDDDGASDDSLAKNNIKQIRWSKKLVRNKEDENDIHQESDLGTYQQPRVFSVGVESVGETPETPVLSRDVKKKTGPEVLWEFWKMPPFDSLERSGKKAKAGNVEERKKIIVETLAQFGIIVEPADAKIGPTVTQYSFRPAPGVKLEKITGLGNNLAMALSAHPIRIEAPIPKTSFVGIEVPNYVPEQVRLRDMLESDEFQKNSSDLMIALGKDVSGDFVFGDLEKMPHLMVAGSTGSGKSVCINSILVSLLYRNSPELLQLILIDPKRVELSLYSGIPHLICPVIVENKKVVNVLRWAVNQMEERYKLLQECQFKKIQSYNEKILRKRKQGIENNMSLLPYIVIVIDELADLMGSHGKQVEGAIVRLAQMARAVGIHLIVSTQRPSVQVVTGLIKTNITTRIAFKVATQIDSRTILDRAGSEKLLGNGDMLYNNGTDPVLRRVQGVYVSEAEVKKIVSFIREQSEKIKSAFGDKVDFQLSNIVRKPEFSGTQQNIDFDFMTEGDESGNAQYEEAKNAVIRKGSASTSFLQRALRIGYNHAAGLIDELEKNGVIGPANGSKPREVHGFPGGNETQHEDSLNDQEKRDKWGF